MRNQVDRLADIRATVRALRAEARAIQAQILGGEVPAEGVEHVATVRRQIVLKPIVGGTAATGNGARPVPMQHPTMWGDA